MNNVKPIRPQDVPAKRTESLPDYVFETFNQLIVEKMDASGSARITQDDVVARLVAKLQTFTMMDDTKARKHVFESGHLNVEDAYRKAGWMVDYDKPGFNETYGAFFVFRKRGNSKGDSEIGEGFIATKIEDTAAVRTNEVTDDG